MDLPVVHRHLLVQINQIVRISTASQSFGKDDLERHCQQAITVYLLLEQETRYVPRDEVRQDEVLKPSLQSTIAPPHDSLAEALPELKHEELNCRLFG